MSDPNNDQALSSLILGVLRTGAPEAGQHNARLLIAVAVAFLREKFGDEHAQKTLLSALGTVGHLQSLDRCVAPPVGAH